MNLILLCVFGIVNSTPIFHDDKDIAEYLFGLKNAKTTTEPPQYYPAITTCATPITTIKYSETSSIDMGTIQTESESYPARGATVSVPATKDEELEFLGCGPICFTLTLFGSYLLCYCLIIGIIIFMEEMNF